MTVSDRTYDIVVIGSGPSGRTLSLRCMRNGFSVALIESELVGGDCHYWACIPSKAMLRPPEALVEARQVDGAKQAATGDMNVESVLTRRDTFVDNWDDSRLSGILTKSGIHIFKGRGQLIAHKRVTVMPTATITDSNNNNMPMTLSARHAVVLCTGSSAVIPNVPGLAEAHPWTSRDATGSKYIPTHLSIMGDGPVACEMADAWSALGSRVTILGRHERILHRYEPFVGKLLEKAFAQRGITVRNNVNIHKVQRYGSKGPIKIALDDGSVMDDTDELLVAVGRKPNTKDLGLETVGLKSQEWLDVDDTGRVKGVEGGDWLYAIGDINHRALLTHVGKYQARACAAAIFERVNYKSDNSSSNPSIPWSRSAAITDHYAVPQVIFTDPQIGSVGLTERKAKSLKEVSTNKNNIHAVDCDTSTLDGAKLHSDEYVGHAKVVIDEERHVIIGATFIGPQVGELLHSATIAIVGEVPLDRLWHAIPSFPTVSEVWINLLENYGF